MKDLYETILKILRGSSASSVLYESAQGADPRAYQVGYSIGGEEAAKSNFVELSLSTSTKLLNKIMKDQGIYYSHDSLDSFKKGFEFGWKDACKRHGKCETLIEAFPKPDPDASSSAENQILRIYRDKINSLTMDPFNAPRGRVMDAQLLRIRVKRDGDSFRETHFVIIFGKDYEKSPWWRQDAGSSDEITSLGHRGKQKVKQDDDDIETLGQRLHLVAQTFERLYRSRGFKVVFSFAPDRIKAHKSVTGGARVHGRASMDAAFKEIATRVKAGEDPEAAIGRVINIDPDLFSVFDSTEAERLRNYLRAQHLLSSEKNPFFRQARNIGKEAGAVADVLKLLDRQDRPAPRSQLSSAALERLRAKILDTVNAATVINTAMLHYLSRHHSEFYQKYLRFKGGLEPGSKNNPFAILNIDEGFREGYILGLEVAIRERLAPFRRPSR